MSVPNVGGRRERLCALLLSFRAREVCRRRRYDCYGVTIRESGAFITIIGWLLSALTKSVGFICTWNPDYSLSTSLISRGPHFDANGPEDVYDREDF